MDTIDFGAVAELYLCPAKGAMRRRIGYRRFGRAADAIRYAVEDLPAGSLGGASLEIGEQRFGGEEIRRLYERADYPLERHPKPAQPIGGSAPPRVLSMAAGRERKKSSRLAKS